MTWSEGSLRIGLAQWHPLPGEAKTNLAVASQLITEPGGAACKLVVMPELWASGYDTDTLAADIAASAEPLDGPHQPVPSGRHE